MSTLGSIVFEPQPGSQTTASQHLSAERVRELLQHEKDNHALRATNAALLAACRSALTWYGPDGDHITDPTRALLLAAIADAESRS